MKTRAHPSSSTKSPPLARAARYSKSVRTFGSTGLHNRRDKRFPSFKQRVVADDSEEGSPKTDPAGPETLSATEASPWPEAVMLWLSWNRVQERLEEKLSHSDHNADKIAALRDEMESLRTRAIALSEELIRSL